MKLLSRGWHRWLKIAEFLGTVQMIVLLSLVYFTILGLVALPFRLVSDPLGFRKPGRSNWVQRPSIEEPLESMRRQG